MGAGRHGLLPLEQLPEWDGAFVQAMRHQVRALPLAGWIAQRDLLNHRKWSPLSMAALHVARQAVEAAGWTTSECEQAAIIFGTSRGASAGWLHPWPKRRPLALMAASNAMHGEAAAAISIELRLRGPYQVVATGCSAGIDALGVAAMHMQVGLAERALVVAVDLPLVPPLLENYAQTGILARGHRNDPYHPMTNGIAPAEAAAALTLERVGTASSPRLLGYLANSDAADALTLAPASGQLARLLQQGISQWGWPQALCPHATGTAAHAKFEPQILREVFAKEPWPSLHLLKPYLGHGIGAGSLLETVVLCAFLQQGQLPPNVAALSAPEPFDVPEQASAASGPVFKIAASLGGHNAIIGLLAANP